MHRLCIEEIVHRAPCDDDDHSNDDGDDGGGDDDGDEHMQR